jgi:hypothetical protein
MCRSLTIRAAPGGVEKTLARTCNGKQEKNDYLNTQLKTRTHNNLQKVSKTFKKLYNEKLKDTSK